MRRGALEAGGAKSTIIWILFSARATWLRRSPDMTDPIYYLPMRIAPRRTDGPVGFDERDLMAAVGANTGTASDYGYVNGYGSAAMYLFDMLRRGHTGDGAEADIEAALHVDELVYAIAFLTRHFAELALKATVRDAHRLRGAIPPATNVHDLNALWPIFEASCALDRRLARFVHEIRPVIDGLVELDASGQTFRYRTDRDDRVHLNNVDLIDISRLEGVFVELRRIVDDLLLTLDGLTYEYSFGTYTAKLSRADLISIAHAQAAAFERSDRGWITVHRRRIRNEYGLTAGEFAEADRLLHRLPFISILVGRENQIDELSVDTMRLLWLGVGAFQQGDDLFSEEEWFGLSALCEMTAVVGQPEDYAHTLRLHRERGLWVRKVDVVRTITRRAADVHRALERLGQRTLARAFIDAWPPDLRD